jgi:hypothetical protein
MSIAPDRTFELPDTIAALPALPFEFSGAAWDEADAVLALEPDALFHRLLRDQEAESTLLAARRVIEAFLRDATGDAPDADGIPGYVAGVRAELAAAIADLAGAEPDVRAAVLRQRAPLGLVSGCWLDVLSQPATQPSVIVNRLFAQYFTLRGEGNPRRAVHHVRRRALEDLDIALPETGAAGFLVAAEARPLTGLHAAFYVALSRLPANFLPELVGVHYAFHALGVDDLLLGTPAPLAEPDLRAVLAAYLELAGPDEQARLCDGVRLAVTLEREHVAMLGELAAWRGGRSLESQVAEIIARHAPLAGTQHRDVRIGDRLLSETLSEPDLDVAAFLREFRESAQIRRGDGSRFIEAVKFGGPMFGIFDEHEASVFKAWTESVRAGERPEIEISVNAAGDARAAELRAAIARSAPAGVVRAEARPRDDRELFHRLINIENFANTLPLAAERAERVLGEAEIMFEHGAGGRYTDATWFDYTPEALYERCERVYWDKLIKPYVPLEEIPDRDMVVFLQTTYALGALVDGAWLHRLGNLGHRERPSDAMLFSIYADEMGHGDLRKNHLTLIHTALASMGIRLPHVRDAAFMDQSELPDDLYGFSLHQLCMALFPDRFYNELLGYNLAIEMFGLGELRLHEIQKLRHYGFDDCYEKAHLTIDNFSAGHTKQAADIIVTYLDGVRRTVGDDLVQREWRRIWRGYASYAYIVEPALLKRIAADAEADPMADLLI